MNLTQEQQDAVRRWAVEGASLSQIQSRLAEEFAVRLSYMDTRFLVIELQAAIQDKPEPKAKEPKTVVLDDAAAAQDDEAFDDETAGPDAADAPGAPADAAGDVSLEISPLARPGFALTGTVVFSDGVKADWGFTNDGRFALDSEKPGYRPSGEDLRQFQAKLRDLMSSRGY